MLEIDRQLLLLLNGSDSVFFDKLIMALTSGFTWIPLYLALLYVVVKNNETTAQILLIIGCAVLCIALADGVADFIAKPYFQRWRPSNDPVIKYAVKVVDNVRGGDYGFFSAHAANTFSLAVFFSLLIKDRLLTLTLVFWSLLNCYTRMYLGLHYPLDILAGLLWGMVAGILSYLVWWKVYYKISPNIHYISSQYTSSGYSLTDVRSIIMVFVFILVYATFSALV